MADRALLYAAGGFCAGLAATYAYNHCQQSPAAQCHSHSETEGDHKATGVQLPLPLRETKHNPPLSIELLTNKQNLDHLTDVKGKRILVRVDYNVKVKKGVVGDRTRIEMTIPTLKSLLAKQPKAIVLITHLGRPGGNFSPKEYSVEPLVPVLQEYLPGVNIQFVPNCIGKETEDAIAKGPEGTIFLLENLRFHPEETGVRVVQDGDKVEKVKSTFAEKVKFRQQLSKLGDVFVFEAFGAAHRPHSSIIGIDLPQRCAGLLMNKEMSYYGGVLGAPKRPFLAIIGGAKVSDKILVLENLINLVDEMIIGGGMAYTFLKVLKNVKIGSSLFDQDGAGVVTKIMKKAKERNVKIHFPVDHIIANKFAADAKVGVTDDERGIPDGWMALDIGPASRTLNSNVMAKASTILWNGPLGVYEMGPFGGGTISAMWDMVIATKRGATTIIGGGDTGAASKYFYVGSKTVADQVSWVSTGGGSSLVLMEGKMLPGVWALSNIGDNSRPPAPKEEDEPEDAGDD